MLLHFIWTAVASLLFFVRVVSILLREPTDVFAVRNSTVSLPCYTNLSVPVSWEIERAGGGINWEHFYKGYGDIPRIYQYKYNVSVDSTRGQYNLTIRNVQPEDAGTYRCGDNLGLGLKMYKEGVPGNGATAELIVIVENEIKCRQESNFNQETIFRIVTGLIKINCNVTYRGNMSPNLYWFLRFSETDERGISLQPYSRNFTTTEGADSKLESEISLNASTVPHQSYIRCEAMGRGENLLTWLSEKIVTPRMGYDFISWTELNKSLSLSEIYPWIVGISIMTIMVVYTVIGCRSEISKCCATVRRRPVSEMTNGETIALNSTSNPEQFEEIELFEIPQNGGIIIDPNTFRPITGVAVVDDKVYVVRHEQQQINVYDPRSRTKLPDVTINDKEYQNLQPMGETAQPMSETAQPIDQTAHWLGGLAGCSHNRALYISDSGLNCIHRVDLTNNVVSSWATDENRDPWGISVTAQGTVLVTMWLRETEGEGTVVEYTSTGKKLDNEIMLDKSIQHAWQTVQLSSDQFVVSHGKDGRIQGSDKSIHRVCVINPNGDIIKVFGSEQGGGDGQLDRPRSIAMDASSGRIYVADYKNHRIVLLNTELGYLGNLHIQHGCKHPFRVCFDSSNDRLFIGEEERGRLLVINSPNLTDSITDLAESLTTPPNKNTNSEQNMSNDSIQNF